MADNTVFGSNTPAEGPIIRDSTAWYHIVIAVDTGQGTAANRVRIYINNQEVTLTITSAVSQNADLFPSSGSSFSVIAVKLFISEKNTVKSFLDVFIVTSN